MRESALAPALEVVNALLRVFPALAVVLAVVLAPLGVAHAEVPIDPTHIDALDEDRTAMNAAMVQLGTKKGKDATIPIEVLTKSVAAMKTDLAKVATALGDEGTKQGTKQTDQAIAKLDAELAAMTKVIAAAPAGAPLTAALFDQLGARHKAVLAQLDALMGLLEPVIFR